MNPNFRNPQVARNINANQSAFPQQKRINANHSALPQQRRINTNQSVFPQKTAFTHDPYAEEMSDHNSHGRQAMDILKEKLANEDALENNQNNNDIGEQNVNHACPTMPAMGPNSHALQAPFPDKRDTTGSSGFVISQPVQYDVFTSAPNVTNGLYQGFSASQQQGEYQNTMRNSHNGALTIMAPAFTDGHIGRDVFSNDHLSSEIVPLEDPAEAFALSQSIVPIELRNRRSRQLNLLTCGPNQCPTAAVGLHADNFPFVEGARLAQATPAYGVIRLRGIPETTRRCEILAIMGRNSKVLNDVQEPVHIIIERVNAVTREAFVEFIDEKAAEDAIQRFDEAKRDGRAPRLGDYPMHYELSSQAALMKAQFPQAKGVQWLGAVPHIIPDHQVQFSWERFKGFISVEEMTVLAKHAEANKNKHCPQRPYECMISMLRKMPWYMADHITVLQRHSMYDAAIRLIKNLRRQVQFETNLYLLNEQLLERLLVSAMLCHGFTVTMKDNIAFSVNLPAERMRDFNMPRFPDQWAQAHTLVPKPGAPLDVLEWYIAIVREVTTQEVEQLPPHELRDVRLQAGRTSLYWGYYWKVLRLSDLLGPAMDNISLGDLARREFHVLTGILSHAFGGHQTNPRQQHQQHQQQLVAPGQQVGFGQQQMINPGQQQLISPDQQQQLDGGQQSDPGSQ